MSRKRAFLLGSVLLLFALILTACGGATPAAEEPAAEEPAAEEPATEEPAAEEPTELRVAAILTAGLENAWDASFVGSFQNIQEEAPHGLTIHDLDYTEGVWGDEAEVIMREYAKTGQYDIIWANSSFSDQVEKLMVEYPEILWVTVGSGNRPLGGNSYLIYQHIHECGYLQGILAGSLTESDTIGIVGTFPADDVNDVANGFISGARSVNPDVKVKVTFIESWYDPPKALEAANAQIAAGVDQMYMMAEAFEPCEENGIICYAKYIDYNFAGPNSVLSSAIMHWEPHIRYIIDEWWNHKTTGEPYDAPMDQVWFSMAEGACNLSPYHGLESIVPQELKDAVAQAEQQILDGTLVVELNTETPVSD